MDDGVHVSEIEISNDGGEEAEFQTTLDSAALARILEEVRNERPSEPHAYNRMHNRHNR